MLENIAFNKEHQCKGHIIINLYAKRQISFKLSIMYLSTFSKLLVWQKEKRKNRPLFIINMIWFLKNYDGIMQLKKV